ncbi:hypothetical protein [Synechococcus sp. MIT S1220]
MAWRNARSLSLSVNKKGSAGARSLRPKDGDRPLGLDWLFLRRS